MILVFSGTGNSKYIADALGDRLCDEVVSLNDIIKFGKEKSFESENPYVIVSPIYAWRFPEIVENIIETAEFRGSKEIYFVGTMGENSGKCDRFVSKTALKTGMNCMGFRGIVMPNNYLIAGAMKSSEVNDAIIEKAIPQIDEIALAIKAGNKIHRTDRTVMAGFCSGPVHNMFTKYMHSSENFKVSDSCISCGKCANLCVMNNISMGEDNRPVFGKNCINCLACIQYCPVQAINVPGKTENNGRYTCKEYKG